MQTRQRVGIIAEFFDEILLDGRYVGLPDTEDRARFHLDGKRVNQSGTLSSRVPVERQLPASIA